jgi:hypothetical protein
MAVRDWRTVLVWIAVGFALLEVATVVLIGVVPVWGLGFAVLFLIAAYWLRRGGTGGILMTGVLCLWEVLGVAVFPKPTTLDVILQAIGLVLGVAGLVVAGLAFRDRRIVHTR